MVGMKKGDPASCRAFIAYFEKPLYNYLYWLTGDPEGASDLFQQCMGQVYNNLGRARKAASPEEWVYRHATLRCLEQARRSQQQKRSSWDNILRSGLAVANDSKWPLWEDVEDSSDGGSPDRNSFLVDALKYLKLPERAAVLLVCVVGINPDRLGDCLHLSHRRAERLLLGAYDRIAVSVKDGNDAQSAPKPKGMRENIRRKLLGLLSPGRERKLAAALESIEGGAALLAAEEKTLAAIRRLPAIAPVTGLVDGAEAHLRAGQEAQEVRIATWGFRFMQVTVPVFILAIIAIILLPTISRSLEAARLAAASENLQEIGKALLAFSEQSPGNRLPPMVTDLPGVWVPDLRLLYPRYIKDPALLVRPSLNDPALLKAMQNALSQSPPDFAQAHALMARSYVYTGYVLLDEAALAAFKTATNGADAPDVESDIDTADKMLRRLKKDVEYFFVVDRGNPMAATSIRASIPIMFETFNSKAFGRDPDGANVLYLDGHVDYVRFGSKFPITAGVQDLLNNDN